MKLLDYVYIKLLCENNLRPRLGLQVFVETSVHREKVKSLLICLSLIWQTAKLVGSVRDSPADHSYHYFTEST